jgi:general secretion pathway protein C
MATSVQTLWLTRIVSFLLAAATAASAVFWGLKWSNPLEPVKATAVQLQAPVQADSAIVAKVLGGGPAAPTAAPLASTRFVLMGVIAAGTQAGAALIAVDGKPPKPVRMGATVIEDWVLRSLQTRRAVWGHAAGSGEEVQIELPTLTKIKIGL